MTTQTVGAKHTEPILDKRFRREFELARTSTHPHLVHAIDHTATPLSSPRISSPEVFGVPRKVVFQAGDTVPA